jgi:hypothetical protein
MRRKDGIEKFIHDNRRTFEAERPGAAVWERLQQRLGEAEKDKGVQPGRVRPFSGGKRWLSVAAILLLCVSMAAFVRTFQIRKQAIDSFVPPDLREAQAYYESRIDQQMDRIKSAMSDRPGQDTLLSRLSTGQDAAYGRLRKALRENPGDQHVRAAFIGYYRSRLAVLDKIGDRLSEETAWNTPQGKY